MSTSLSTKSSLTSNADHRLLRAAALGGEGAVANLPDTHGVNLRAKSPKLSLMDFTTPHK
eukprot:2211199-Pyramimonas_sp.AAC.1